MSGSITSPRTDDGCGKSRKIDSVTLFDGAKVLTILHQDEEYRLQITAAKKLILTK